MIWTALQGEGSCLMAVNIAALLIKLLLSPRWTLNTATWGIQTMFGECNLSHSRYTFCVSGAPDLRHLAVFEIFLSCCRFFLFNGFDGLAVSAESEGLSDEVTEIKCVFFQVYAAFFFSPSFLFSPSDAKNATVLRRQASTRRRSAIHPHAQCEDAVRLDGLISGFV